MKISNLFSTTVTGYTSRSVRSQSESTWQSSMYTETALNSMSGSISSKGWWTCSEFSQVDSASESCSNPNCIWATVGGKDEAQCFPRSEVSARRDKIEAVGVNFPLHQHVNPAPVGSSLGCKSVLMC